MFVIPSQWHLIRSEQESEQSWMRINHSGFLTFVSKYFCLYGILENDIYFIKY